MARNMMTRSAFFLMGVAIFTAPWTVRAATPRTYYSVAAYECKRLKSMFGFLNSARVAEDKTPVIFAVPVNQTCHIQYDNTRKWFCGAADTQTGKGAQIEIAQGVKKPNSGKIFRASEVPKDRKADAHMVPGEGTDIDWTRQFAVIGNIQRHDNLCIRKTTRHPRVFGVQLELKVEVGYREGRTFFSDIFKAIPNTQNSIDLVVTNTRSSIFPPLYEVYYDDNRGYWVIEFYEGEARRHYVEGKAIAIKAVPTEDNSLSFVLTKATNIKSDKAVAFILPRVNLTTKFTSKKAKFTTEKSQGRKAIKIMLGSIAGESTPVLPPLIAGAKAVDFGYENDENESGSMGMGSQPSPPRSGSRSNLCTSTPTALQKQKLLPPLPPRAPSHRGRSRGNMYQYALSQHASNPFYEPVARGA